MAQTVTGFDWTQSLSVLGPQGVVRTSDFSSCDSTCDLSQLITIEAAKIKINFQIGLDLPSSIHCICSELGRGS